MFVVCCHFDFEASSFSIHNKEARTQQTEANEQFYSEKKAEGKLYVRLFFWSERRESSSSLSLSLSLSCSLFLLYLSFLLFFLLFLF